MDTNNWRPPTPSSEGVPDGGDWRTQLQPDSRSRIVNKIMDTLKRHLPYSGPEGMNELKKIATRFEEKIYTSATSQPDYLRKISVKMLTMETKSHANGMPTNSGGNGSRPPDAGMQPQIQNQVQQIPNSLATQSQAHQQMLLQNIQNNLPSATVQGSGSLSTTLPPGSSLGQNSSMQNANMQNISQNANMQNISQNANMQNISQNSLVNTMAQGLNSSIFVGQRQMPGRQQVVPQQQQQSQNPQQQYLLQQQQMIIKQKLQQGNMMMTNQIQQQQQPQQQTQQQNMLQTGQLQHQQSVMQPNAMQQGPLSGMQQNQQSSVQQSTQPMLQHHQQPVLRHQQQSQQAIHQQQQQQHTGQQQTMQPTQFSSQQNNMGELQQQQQQQQQQPKMMSQQNNHQNLQQQQQQQLMSQQNNLSNLHGQQLAPQTNVSGLHQQQPLMGAQSGGQHPVHMLQSSKAVQQQMQSGSSNMLQSQGQQPQLQTMQQQLMSQMQSQPGQLQQQQQVGLPQQQQNSLQQRVQPSGSLLQQQNVIDQQKQMFQSQRALPETSMDSATSQPGHASGGDLQEELHQKIKALKDSYFPELNSMYQRIAVKLQQHDALPQQPKSDQIDKLRVYKTMLERLLSIMQCPKTELNPGLRDKLDQYEKQIVNLINMNKPRKPGPMQQNQIHPHHMSSMQPQQSQSQMSQVSLNENQMNPQMQTSMSLQNQVQPSSISSVSNPQQTMMNSLQHNPSMETGQGNAMSSMQQQQQVGVGSMQQQNSVSSAQQMNISSQSGLNMLQPNVNNLQTNMNMLQHQNLKPHQEQHLLQTQQQQQQQFKQMQHRQMMLQKQQLIQQQQLHQQAKQQLPTQLQTHQMSQIHQMNEVADVKLRSNVGVKGVFQHQPPGPRPPYAQMKPGSSFPISSPQLLQAQSPQLSQHSSPQIDQQNMLTSMTKIGTPLQSANSPFVVPSPSTPLAPSPMPGDPEKSISGMQPHSNAGNMGHHHINSAQTVTAPSPAIGTPGISASPLLAEFSGPDGGAHGHPSAAVSSKSTVTELPIERLMRVVKSLPSQSLSDAVTDISSVVSMVDRIAGAAPGNGSRAAVGEDLVAMTKCRLQARNFMLQDGPTGSRKMRRYTSAMPLNAASSAGSVNDSFKQSMGAAEAADLESTATSSIKRPRIQGGSHALVEQIREINQKLMDTVVDICNEEVDTCGVTEGGDGVIVKCSFNAVALSPELKSQYASAQLTPIQPLRLLVPSNYPNCSPVLLDKFPVEVSRGEYEDVSAKAKSRFSICLRSISQPMSLKEIARTWDESCRAAILECAEKNGGGSFSSKYGTWESCVSAA